MNKKIKKQIFKKIKEFDTIVIARHIGADPDALASQIALRDVILNTYPNKKVYAVGFPASRFKFLGLLDKEPIQDYENALLIVTDTPDKKRVDISEFNKFKYTIKIDHHPFIEKFCDLEWIDDKASSASQMVLELIYETKLKLTKEAAEKIYLGLIADTNRFLFYYTTSKTFSLVSRLLKDFNIDITSLYEELYLRPFKEIKFQGFIANNLTVTENGFAYMKIDEKILKEYNVDAATAGNMVNNFNYIEGIFAWGIFSYDANNNNIRGSIRSRGPIINEVAALFNGGGHIYASGVRLKEFNQVDELAVEMDKVCLEYKEKTHRN